MEGSVEADLFDKARRIAMDTKETPKVSKSGEVRYTDPKTGAQKGTKLARFDLLPSVPLWELAEHYGKGCKKYAARNYQKGYNWSLSIAALGRHLALFMAGEDFDNHNPDCTPDCLEHTGSAHVICICWHALALREFMLRHPELDDRECRFYENLIKDDIVKALKETKTECPAEPTSSYVHQ